MKKISLCCLVILLALLFTACGSSSKAKDTDTATSATYISEMEARIYFYEITSVYRYELMTLGEEEIKNGVDPKYWDGLADEVAELTLSEMTGTYISEEEKTLLSTTYGVTANNVVFGIYRISDVQAGIDYLFGSGRCDVSAWNHNNVDILKTNIFGTASGYFLCSKSEEKSYANQIYKVVSVKGGEETDVHPCQRFQLALRTEFGENGGIPRRQIRRRQLRHTGGEQQRVLSRSDLPLYA